MTEFLFEIGLEEVPARMIAGAVAELERRVVAMLTRERLLAGAEAPEVRRFATPRRLAVLVRGVQLRQQDAAEEMLGPSAAIAFRDGVATPAAVAFAKKAGVSVDALTTTTTAKGEYVRARVVRAGRSAAEVIAGELPKELAEIYWAKNMYWRPGKPERFVRPVRWLLALLDDDVVAMSFAGKSTGNVTYGHRVLHGDAPVVIERPAEYEDVLAGVYVVADVEARRHKIRKGLDRVCRAAGDGLRWREDHEQVETVTQLTEWPTVLAGGFEGEYLSLPEEVLVTVMRDHQKYFAVEDAEGGLAAHFLAVLNTEVDADGERVIRHGNERVLRARFNDARFFWEFDQRVSLRDRVALLDKVVFQKDLGSYAAKAERVSRVAARLAGLVGERAEAVDARALERAVRLAKTDLTTELVKEFTELQGIVGGLYARAQGLQERVATAIYDQYRPEGMEDRVPRSTEGALLAIADKADTVAGMFGLGMEPTGSKDPFALRRAANGVVKILAEIPLPLTLREIAVAAAAAEDGPLAERLVRFFAERLEFFLREAKGNAYDVVAAVLAAGSDDVQDAAARAQALTEVRQEDAAAGDFAAVSAAFKRMSNILEQAREKGIAVPGAVDAALLLEPEEGALAERSEEIARDVEELRAERQYGAALRLIASLRPQVDGFFDAVMVMAPEPELRGNRLALLARVRGDLSRIADFSKIVAAG